MIVTPSQKSELYRKTYNIRKTEMSAKEWQKIQYTLIHQTGFGLVLITIALMWMVGSR